MSLHQNTKSEGMLGLLYTLTAGVGFVTDALVLSLCLHFHMQPAWARVISLTTAMQATFWINGLLVFHCLTRQGWVGAWLGYMVTNGFGNFCNYWVFVTLISLHNPLWSNRWLDLAIGGFVAWAINYSCARFLIFGKGAPKGGASIGEVGRDMATRLNALIHPRLSAPGTAPPPER